MLVVLPDYIVLTPYQNVAGVRYIDFYIILVLNIIVYLVYGQASTHTVPEKLAPFLK